MPMALRDHSKYLLQGNPLGAAVSDYVSGKRKVLKSNILGALGIGKQDAGYITGWLAELGYAPYGQRIRANSGRYEEVWEKRGARLGPRAIRPRKQYNFLGGRWSYEKKAKMPYETEYGDIWVRIPDEVSEDPVSYVRAGTPFYVLRLEHVSEADMSYEPSKRKRKNDRLKVILTRDDEHSLLFVLKGAKRETVHGKRRWEVLYHYGTRTATVRVSLPITKARVINQVLPAVHRRLFKERLMSESYEVCPHEYGEEASWRDEKDRNIRVSVRYADVDNLPKELSVEALRRAVEALKG